MHPYIILSFPPPPVCDLVCQNGGTPNTVNCSQCTCPAGYTGSNCETDIDECSIPEYCVNGTCTNSVGGYDCQCLEGYDGDKCDVNIDDCVPNECQNGGTCIDEVAGFRCECPDRFSGQTCEFCDIAHCQSCGFVTSQVQCTKCEDGYTLSAEGFCSKFEFLHLFGLLLLQRVYFLQVVGQKAV